MLYQELLCARTNRRRMGLIRAVLLMSVVSLMASAVLRASSGIDHVFFTSQDGHVNEFYLMNGIWERTDLTANTNGPLASAVSGLTSFFDGSNEHVFYVSQDSHVHELYWNGVWNGADLTAITNGPGAYTQLLTSYWDGSNEHVFYLSASGQAHELRWNGTWQDNGYTFPRTIRRPRPSTRYLAF